MSDRGGRSTIPAEKVGPVTGSRRRQTPAGTDSSRLRFLLLAVAGVLLSTLLEIGALGNGEVMDDHVLLHIAAGRGCGTNPLTCFQHPLFGYYYRPVMAASFAAGVALHGTRPLYFHIESLLLHAADVGLAFWMFRLLFRRDTPALLAGLLFGLHPVQVDVSTWIGGRTDILAVFFLFWFAIGLLEEGRHPTQRWLWRAISLLGFSFAVLTKEQCLPLALLAPLLSSPLLQQRASQQRTHQPSSPPCADAEGTDGSLPQEQQESRARSSSAVSAPPSSLSGRLWLLLYALPIGVYLVAAWRIVPHSTIETAPWSPSLHVEMVARTLWYFVKEFCIPTVTILHESSLGPWEPAQPFVVLAGAFIGGVWLALLWRMRLDPVLRIPALWATLALLPCLNLIPVPSQFIASYRALLPLPGVVGLVAAFLAHWLAPQPEPAPGASDPFPSSLLLAPSSFSSANGARDESAFVSGVQRRSPERPSVHILRGGHRTESRMRITQVVALVATVLICVLFAVMTLEDVPVWHDDLTAERTEAMADPNFLPALAAEAQTLHRMGRDREALADDDRVLAQLLPLPAGDAGHVAPARSLEMRLRVQSRSSLRYKAPDFLADVLRDRGSIRQTLGMIDSAAEDYRFALWLRSGDDPAREALVTCDIATGRYTEAEARLHELVRNAPNAAHFARLGYLYYREERWKPARDALARSLQIAKQGGAAGVDVTLVRRLYADAVRKCELNHPLRR